MYRRPTSRKLLLLLPPVTTRILLPSADVSTSVDLLLLKDVVVMVHVLVTDVSLTVTLWDVARTVPPGASEMRMPMVSVPSVRSSARIVSVSVAVLLVTVRYPLLTFSTKSTEVVDSMFSQ